MSLPAAFRHTEKLKFLCAPCNAIFSAMFANLKDEEFSEIP
jgi:hypothetical protein